MLRRAVGLAVALGIATFMLASLACKKEGEGPTGPSYPIDITLSFTGTEGLVFGGAYGNSSESHTIECDTVPASYPIQCKSATDVVAASASFYPAYPPQTGTLTVKLLKDSKTLDEASTSDPAAQISVEWHPGG